MNIKVAFKNSRLLKGITGINQLEFETLIPTFGQLVHELYAAKKRIRAVGGGRKGALPTIEAKLFFILLYVKIYPTYDLLGFIFGIDKSQACRWTFKLMSLLEKALGRACVLPARRINTLKELLSKYPEVKDIFLDGTERITRRPKSRRNQNRRYSGKKKTYTRKNIVGVDEGKKILFLSASKNGRRHDKWRLDQSNWLSGIPPGITLWTDTGFAGIEQEINAGVNVMRPLKRMPKKSLTFEQKQENKTISGLRIVVENAIAGIKRFGSLVQVYRNHKGQDDNYMTIASGLWNLHLQLS